MKVNYDGKLVELEEGANGFVLAKLFDAENKKKDVAYEINGEAFDMSHPLKDGDEVKFIRIGTPEAFEILNHSTSHLMAEAIHHLFPDAKFGFGPAIEEGFYYDVDFGTYVLKEEDLVKIEAEMKKLVKEDARFVRKEVSPEEADEVFKDNPYKKELIAEHRGEGISLYTQGSFTDLCKGIHLPSTGYIKKYKIRLYSPGFLIQYPRSETVGEIPEFEDAPTFNRVLKESHDWAKIVGADTVAGINETIEKAGPIEFINLCEARHNRMLCELGQLIQDDREDIRLICVAGPSSSGKTTFANRLRIELMSRGIRPIRISIDDYYKSKDQCPVDENGNPDLESIEALDIDLFNQNMLDLINGEEVELPRFDFGRGGRVAGRRLKIEEGEPIIIEGIHALNDRLTVSIPKHNKFKIFISPQAQINLDDHNPLSITDLRLIRRLVRDKKFRNASAEETLGMWPSVRKGEFKWIYSTQEGSDYVYNSMLSYELPVMRKYAMPLLAEIDKESPYHPVATRLLRMLKFFVDMDDDWVPSNSLMREFIGGSCYADV